MPFAGQARPAPLSLGRLHRPFAVWPWQQVTELREPQPLAPGSGDHHGRLAVSVDPKIGGVCQGPGH